MILVHHSSKILSLKFAVALNTSILESNCSQTFQARLVCKWPGLQTLKEKHPLWHAEIHKKNGTHVIPMGQHTHTIYIYIIYIYIVSPCQISIGNSTFSSAGDFRIVAFSSVAFSAGAALSGWSENIRKHPKTKSTWSIFPNKNRGQSVNHNESLLVGGWTNPIWKILVNLEHFSQ